jgi:hypothetical protein
MKSVLIALVLSVSASSRRRSTPSSTLGLWVRVSPQRWSDFSTPLGRFGWDMKCRLFRERISLRVRLGRDRHKWKMDAAMNIDWKTRETI